MLFQSLQCSPHPYMQGEVGKTFHRFSGDSQQDSQEFLTAVLERVHDSLKTKVGVAPPAARVRTEY